MTFSVHFDEQQRLVYTRFSGIVTTSEVREANQLIAPQDDSSRMLFDGTRMRMFDVSDDYLEKLGERMSTELPVRYRAIVVGNRHLEQIEMFAAHASTGFRNVRAFVDLESACQWLLIPDAGRYLSEVVPAELAPLTMAEVVPVVQVAS